MTDFSDADVSVQGFCGVLQLTLSFADAGWKDASHAMAEVRAALVAAT
jgi:hypothetical protein